MHLYTPRAHVLLSRASNCAENAIYHLFSSFVCGISRSDCRFELQFFWSRLGNAIRAQYQLENFMNEYSLFLASDKAVRHAFKYRLSGHLSCNFRYDMNIDIFRKQLIIGFGASYRLNIKI